MTDLQRFAGNLRRLRGCKSQTELAELAGTTQSHISEYETGATVPDLITVYRLAGALGVSVGKLMEEQTP